MFKDMTRSTCSSDKSEVTFDIEHATKVCLKRLRGLTLVILPSLPTVKQGDITNMGTCHTSPLQAATIGYPLPEDTSHDPLPRDTAQRPTKSVSRKPPQIAQFAPHLSSNHQPLGNFSTPGAHRPASLIRALSKMGKVTM